MGDVWGMLSPSVFRILGCYHEKSSTGIFILKAKFFGLTKPSQANHLICWVCSFFLICKIIHVLEIVIIRVTNICEVINSISLV